MMAGNGQLSVPPGFRFHPTDEELLYYYLRKKVAFEAIDLDVIRDIDLNKVEPWDLKDKCRLGSGPQSDWYFFSHKDKKYPTGTRTNRATGAGFWKATGRDKVIHLGSLRRIGMRKTLVFYTGRAPHGQKTDWIMHEYRLDDDHNSDVQEEGWVVCRVFKKKSHQRADVLTEQGGLEENHLDHFRASGSTRVEQKQHLQIPYDFSFDNSMHLPQLLSSESMGTAPLMAASASVSMTDPAVCSSQNQLTKLAPGDQQLAGLFQHERFTGDWSILERLLGSHQNQDQIFQGRYGNPTIPSQPLEINCLGALRFPVQYHECEADLFKFSNK